MPQCGSGTLTTFYKAAGQFQGVTSQSWDGKIMSWKCFPNATFDNYQTSSKMYVNGNFVGGSSQYSTYGAGSTITPGVWLKIVPLLAVVSCYFLGGG